MHLANELSSIPCRKHLFFLRWAFSVVVPHRAARFEAITQTDAATDQKLDIVQHMSCVHHELATIARSLRLDNLFLRRQINALHKHDDRDVEKMEQLVTALETSVDRLETEKAGLLCENQVLQSNLEKVAAIVDVWRV